MSNDDAVQALVDFFQKTSWPVYLDERKVRDRCSVIPGNSNGDSLIVEIERHRPILGAEYTKGLGMAAFETYFMRYAVSDSGGGVIELPERSLCMDYDANSLADEYTGYDQISLSVIRKGDAFVIEDTVTKEQEAVKNIEEAQLFGQSIADAAIESFTEQFDFEPTQCLTANQRKALIEDVSRAIYDNIEALVKSAWNNPDED